MQQAQPFQPRKPSPPSERNYYISLPSTTVKIHCASRNLHTAYEGVPPPACGEDFLRPEGSGSFPLSRAIPYPLTVRIRAAALQRSPSHREGLATGNRTVNGTFRPARAAVRRPVEHGKAFARRTCSLCGKVLTVLAYRSRRITLQGGRVASGSHADHQLRPSTLSLPSAVPHITVRVYVAKPGT